VPGLSARGVSVGGWLSIGVSVEEVPPMSGHASAFLTLQTKTGRMNQPYDGFGGWFDI
jgi:hypothetical protein